MAKSPNAIQWSKSEIRSMMLNPASHPIIGIIAWNVPKKKPVFSASIAILVLVFVNPLVMETENESIAKAIAMSIIVMSIPTSFQ